MRLFFKKFFSKKTLKVLFCFVCVLFLVLTPSFVFNKENYSRDINRYFKNGKASEQIVLSLWHIESFEGGKKNRKSFLEEIGIKFNKKNSNIYLSVLTLTEEQLFLNLQNGLMPDLFSFSIGSGRIISSYLEELDKNNVIRKELQEVE